MKVAELFEARRKKVKDPYEWSDIETINYDTWRHEVELSKGKFPVGHTQLFVPRWDHQDFADRKLRKRLWDTVAELEERVVKEAVSITPPILTASRESPPGNNKPANTFWTSTAIVTGEFNGRKTYTSRWVEYWSNNGRRKQSPVGFLFEVKEDTYVFDLDDHSAIHAYHIANDLGTVKGDANKQHEHYGNLDITHNFPWDFISHHFDAVNYRGGGYNDSTEFTYGWDCESTAWWNTSKLIYKGAAFIRTKDEKQSSLEDVFN